MSVQIWLYVFCYIIKAACNLNYLKQNADKVRELFDKVKPQGYTPIGEKLESLLLFYMDNLENNKARIKKGELKVPLIRPVNYIVITDGVPSMFSYS